MTWNPLAAIFDIQRKVNALTIKVASMSDQQAEIDADVAQLQADDTTIEAEIAKLKAADPALDLSGLEAAIAATGQIAPPAT